MSSINNLKCEPSSSDFSRTNQVRVLYEISVLGESMQKSMSRTGVYRVAEEMLRALHASGGCKLRCCVFENSELLRFAAEWLKTQPELADTKLVPEYAKSPINERFLAVRERAMARGRKTLSDKVMIEALQALRRLSGAYKPIDWRWPQILHLPFYINRPEPIAKKGPIEFQMIHDMIPVLFPKFFNGDSSRKFLERKFSRQSPRQWFFSNSQSTKNDICNFAPHLDADRIVVTPLAAGEHFRPCENKSRIESVLRSYKIPPEPFFLSVCTLEPRKNLVHVIQAFRRLIEQEEISELNLVLVGTKGWQYDRILVEAGATPALRRRIIFTGYLPDEDLAPLYTSALAFLYLSLYEGFGLPVLEAMQCSTPVVASNISSLPEVVGDAGILLDAMDKDALCASLFRLYNSPALRTELSEKSLLQAAKFSWSQCARSVISGYEQALH